MTPIRATALTCLLVGLAAACDSGVTDPPSDSQERLLVLMHQPGSEPAYLRISDIYRIDADGSNAINLTNRPARYAGLDLSPDGRTLAFDSDRAGNGNHIWLMSPDGSNLRRIVEDGVNYGPRWSPDGSRIAFLRNVGGEQSVAVVSASGGTPVDVSSAAIAADEPCTGSEPRRLQLIGWAPDGRVLFSNYICGFGYRHYIVSADGSQHLESDMDFMTTWWSPDGSRIALNDKDAPNHPMIMSADGSDVRSLTSQPGDVRLISRSGITQYLADYNPWSPSGNELVVESWAGGTPTLAAIRVDGSNPRSLTPWPAEFNGWSADGSRLAVTRNGGSWAVYTVNADGSGLFNLTENFGDASNAIWLPD